MDYRQWVIPNLGMSRSPTDTQRGNRIEMITVGTQRIQFLKNLKIDSNETKIQEKFTKVAREPIEGLKIGEII